jgi:hypothetical protein
MRLQCDVALGTLTAVMVNSLIAAIFALMVAQKWHP